MGESEEKRYYLECRLLVEEEEQPEEEPEAVPAETVEYEDEAIFESELSEDAEISEEPVTDEIIPETADVIPETTENVENETEQFVLEIAEEPAPETVIAEEKSEIVLKNEEQNNTDCEEQELEEDFIIEAPNNK